MSIKVPVLDHGFVTLRNIAGPTRRVSIELSLCETNIREFDADDIDPANAARISFDNLDEVRPREDDLKLCKYLMKNLHTSPFEMITVWLEMKIPIFVARQFVRHRTVSINEVSGRYVQLPEEWYIPEVVGGKPPPGHTKQGQQDNLDGGIQRRFKDDLNDACSRCYDEYKYYLVEGVAAEHARMFLHLNHNTHWLWKQDLHNMMHFLSLRDHPHAQIESQQYAKAIDQLLRGVLPHSMALYDEFRKRA